MTRASASAPPMSCMARNIGTELGAMPVKVSENIRADGDGWVGEAGGAGEPVRGGDVAGDGEGDRVGPAAAQRPEDDQHQAEGGDDLTEPQPAAGAVGGARW